MTKKLQEYEADYSPQDKGNTTGSISVECLHFFPLKLVTRRYVVMKIKEKLAILS